MPAVAIADTCKHRIAADFMNAAKVMSKGAAAVREDITKLLRVVKCEVSNTLVKHVVDLDIAKRLDKAIAIVSNFDADFIWRLYE